MNIQAAKLLTLVSGPPAAALLLSARAFSLQVGLGRGYHWLSADDDTRRRAARPPISIACRSSWPPGKRVLPRPMRVPLFNEESQTDPDAPGRKPDRRPHRRYTVETSA